MKQKYTFKFKIDFHMKNVFFLRKFVHLYSMNYIELKMKLMNNFQHLKMILTYDNLKQ
jgi:hypothetical protein